MLYMLKLFRSNHLPAKMEKKIQNHYFLFIIAWISLSLSNDETQKKKILLCSKDTQMA